MTRKRLADAYFDWMCKLVCEKQSTRNKYHKLLIFLHQTPFDYTIPMDGNRADDGTEIRYRFGYENDIPQTEIALIDDGPCSMLEMMVALAWRMEETIMNNPDAGNRIGRWFWDMIESLGLSDMTEAKFDEDKASTIIDIFLDHDYARNGKGGLFTVNGPYDMRDYEIWYQMMWYLNDILDNEGSE